MTAAGAGVEMDVSPETARDHDDGDASRPGTSVNLERSLRAGARLGGHFVQGHVDATGTHRVDRAARGVLLADDSYTRRRSARYIVQKGSIAVDGISLTVADLDERAIRRADHPVHLAAHEPAAR